MSQNLPPRGQPKNAGQFRSTERSEVSVDVGRAGVESPAARPAMPSPSMMAGQVRKRPVGARPNEPHYVYHRELGLPSRHIKALGVLDPQGRSVRLEWTRHAKDAVADDRYGRVEMPDTLNTRDPRLGGAWSLVETKERKTDGGLEKALFRSQPDEYGRCTCLVVAVSGGRTTRTSWTVVTSWVNEDNDSHSTLDETKYDRP